MDQNQEDIRLLRENPGMLLLRYRPMVEAIVQIQINRGSIQRSEKQEYVHSIMDEFLKRIASIRKQYNHKALLRTYSAAIFRNLCNDKIRRSQLGNRTRVLRDSDTIAYGASNPLNELAIREEVEVFGKIFSLFSKNRAKAQLFLKAYFRIPLSESDVSGYYSGAGPAELAHWREEISSAFDHRDMKIYEALSRISKNAEGKQSSKDAIRKWIKARLNDLVNLMNKSRDCCHDTETVQMLAERYFYQDEPELDSIKEKKAKG